MVVIKIRLKEELKLRKISIREFSRMVDYPFESVRKLVNGDVSLFSKELLERCCHELHLDMSDLFVTVRRKDDTA